MPRNPSTAEFFEALYQERNDPWNFAASDYEQGRFRTILSLLSPGRFRHTFEPGCSIGTLTEHLATISDRVTACDLSATAVSRAQERCSPLKHVRFSVAGLTQQTPVAGYDLVVISEIGYYFSPTEWESTVRALTAEMDPGTTILASHWLGESNDHKQSGDQVHATLLEDPLLLEETNARFPGFRINRFTRR